MSAKENFEALQSAYGEAELWEEGGEPYVYLPNLQFDTRAGKVQVDALLCPHAHSSYPTRLFLSKQLSGTSANFNGNSVIGGRSWHAASWNNVPMSLPWLEILACHLKAFQ